MTAKLVNLRTRRKQQARGDRLKTAGAAAPLPGRHERETARAEAEREARRLEGHRLDPETPGDDP